jgi:hypothetical protein
MMRTAEPYRVRHGPQMPHGEQSREDQHRERHEVHGPPVCDLSADDGHKSYEVEEEEPSYQARDIECPPTSSQPALVRDD